MQADGIGYGKGIAVILIKKNLPKQKDCNPEATPQDQLCYPFYPMYYNYLDTKMHNQSNVKSMGRGRRSKMK